MPSLSACIWYPGTTAERSRGLEIYVTFSPLNFSFQMAKEEEEEVGKSRQGGRREEEEKTEINNNQLKRMRGERKHGGKGRGVSE